MVISNGVVWKNWCVQHGSGTAGLTSHFGVMCQGILYWYIDTDLIPLSTRKHNYGKFSLHFLRCLLGILVQIQLQVFCVVPKIIIFSSTVFRALGWKSRASAMVLQVDEISNVHAVCLHCVAEARILHLPSAPDVPAASTSSAEELFATMPDLSFSCSSIAGPARHGPHKFAIKSLMVSTKSFSSWCCHPLICSENPGWHFLLISNPQAQNPSMQYRDAFLKACEDYNSYGAAMSNRKLQIDTVMALKLYGLKAPNFEQIPFVGSTPLTLEFGWIWNFLGGR